MNREKMKGALERYLTFVGLYSAQTVEDLLVIVEEVEKQEER